MKKWLKLLLLLILLLLAGLGAFGLYVYQTVKQVMEHTYEPLPQPTGMSTPVPASDSANKTSSATTTPTPSIVNTEPFSVLFMGIDQRSGEGGRSDTLMVMTVNPDTHSLLMFNIPRDTRTTIIGLGKEDKINHAYAYGGVPMAVATVEQFLQTKLDYYVKVNMNEFVKIIDELGGVTVDNKHAFSYEGHHFPVGTLHLQGEEALAYCRMRYDDPKGDLGRNERQRQVVRSLMDQGSQPEVLTRAEAIFAHVERSMKTNITFEEWKKLVLEYRTNIYHGEVLEIRGENQQINGIYYYLVSTDERKRLHAALEKSLGIIPSPPTLEWRQNKLKE